MRWRMIALTLYARMACGARERSFPRRLSPYSQPFAWPPTRFGRSCLHSLWSPGEAAACRFVAPTHEALDTPHNAALLHLHPCLQIHHITPWRFLKSVPLAVPRASSCLTSGVWTSSLQSRASPTLLFGRTLGRTFAKAKGFHYVSKLPKFKRITLGETHTSDKGFELGTSEGRTLGQTVYHLLRNSAWCGFSHSNMRTNASRSHIVTILWNPCGQCNGQGERNLSCFDVSWGMCQDESDCVRVSHTSAHFPPFAPPQMPSHTLVFLCLFASFFIQ